MGPEGLPGPTPCTPAPGSSLTTAALTGRCVWRTDTPWGLPTSHRQDGSRRSAACTATAIPASGVLQPTSGTLALNTTLAQHCSDKRPQEAGSRMQRSGEGGKEAGSEPHGWARLSHNAVQPRAAPRPRPNSTDAPRPRAGTAWADLGVQLSGHVALHRSQEACQALLAGARGGPRQDDQPPPSTKTASVTSSVLIHPGHHTLPTSKAKAPSHFCQQLLLIRGRGSPVEPTQEGAFVLARQRSSIRSPGHRGRVLSQPPPLTRLQQTELVPGVRAPPTRARRTTRHTLSTQPPVPSRWGKNRPEELWAMLPEMAAPVRHLPLSPRGQHPGYWGQGLVHLLTMALKQ